ncbi:hypothetical protein [Thiolapillus brandeum]|uniref:Uncharacterized protein n=1 Tax=Thiolapillus brandeum TaxID=1076588 RepID=A0A7U6JLB2_9GAMM|nr:hypothetical protein [Thiolapillus brandeum]BAO45670.1 conserved hypothetical protein [Thiolapillus brandeum]
MITLPEDILEISKSDKAGFSAMLKKELKNLGLSGLPLQQGLSSSSVALDDKLQVVLLNIEDDTDRILVRAGLFYTGIIAGCSCADDPGPVEEQNEHCEVAIEILKATGTASIKLI